MDERNQPYGPPGGGQPPPPPPPPMYPVTSDIPPSSPYHYSPAPTSRRNSGILGGILSALLAVWAVAKYALIFVAKVPALATLLTGLIAVGAYALLFPWQVAVGLVGMIFIHEMGHVFEIRRQGMAATAPIFIPFLGAAIFQRSHAQSAVRQAQIGIAGPIAGTVAAAVSLVLYTSTHFDLFLVWAYFGFWINLFNLIPFGMLDGGWITAPIGKWVQVAGLAILAALFFAGQVNPLVLIVVALGMPMVYRRFKDRAYDAYLTSGPPSARFALGAAWLVLVVFLGVAFFQTETMLHALRSVN
ncbi:MAG TPA: site-2 protease family protein [Candidatus Dormibacteraeota bacterium]